MASLIVVVVAICFFVASVFIGMNDLNYNEYERKITESEVMTDFIIYETAISSYKKVINIYPSNENWENEISKIHMVLPKNEGKYSYKHIPSPSHAEEEWVGVCYEDTVERELFENIESIHEKGITVLSKNCFSKQDSLIDKTEEKISFSLTKWIKADWNNINRGA